ncbi:biotin carboxylase N-terminal domain-containing protein [Nocardioides sp. zg-1228]|uniref:ATP-binding protein n=1 Tax=Nocardioides sp. zg-1228 TaxID=2763008 RepID=UPI0016424EBB|nr:biotin carboxylase N-terminal domain-containing protein [Nocardioides sp. zg-1228]MBC2931918.1 biotin/lipoyl-binding protein [Nocardioides sp. zg-1228]QSF57479.1 biotin/lipoyl-binding protein [Nocardioides sp. zg-1228]
MISRVLVANRGEIARRVFATCRRLGIDTVAVHSDADAELPFVTEADRAVRLPGNTPAETYLRADLIIDAARRAGADAIHPGYGFLSENAGFARAVEAAGLTWIGPAPESIESMGSKVGSKELMRAAGVPVLEAPDSPTEADLPLLVKASAGGGGRGMRIVRDLAALEGEIARASDEAASAFGDGTVFVEPYVEVGRHVEVQVVGDGAGEVLVLGERDCTVQRRHQKVVEEAPAPRLPEAVAKELHEAARRAAAAIDYRGAGTVEFLYDPAKERFWFLEMNTRLQVEHPVTELVHGVDLVELQLAVAQGEADAAFAAAQDATTRVDGHAIEVRLYAEDSTWTPQSGPLVSLEIEHEAAFGPLARAGIRLDSGFASGNEVGTHYDAMLAKVISWAPTRAQATRQLVAALRRARIHGLTVNRDQLVEILSDPAFASMDVTTSWLETREVAAPEAVEGTDPAAVAAALLLAADDARRRTVQAGLPPAWRNVVSQPQRTTLVPLGATAPDAGAEVVVEWHGTRTGFAVEGVTVLSAGPEAVRLEVDGVASTWAGRIVADTRTGARDVYLDGPDGASTWHHPPRFTDPADQVVAGSLLAPMPGSVVTVAVAAGDRVSAGQLLLVMEAMKMQHSVTAPADGVVAEINVEPGSQVAAGQVLVVVSDDLEQGADA